MAVATPGPRQSPLERRIARAREGWTRHRDLVLRWYADHTAGELYAVRHTFLGQEIEERWCRWDDPAPTIVPLCDGVEWQSFDGRAYLDTPRLLDAHIMPIVTVRAAGDVFECLRLVPPSSEDRVRLHALAEAARPAWCPPPIRVGVVDLGDVMRCFDARTVLADDWVGYGPIDAARSSQTHLPPAHKVVWVLAGNVASLLNEFNDAAAVVWLSRLRDLSPGATLWLYVDLGGWQPKAALAAAARAVGVVFLPEMPMLVTPEGTRSVLAILGDVAPLHATIE
jgi:hypothetical protein